ncbi:glucose transporter GlcP-like isoform X3 [Halichondria panicea]|uniref:glucose transporter GlcP-like isoform X3 n=2 Tax=Halichondria panicea TaxID=6063 RepID=UPI00312BBAA6
MLKLKMAPGCECKWCYVVTCSAFIGSSWFLVGYDISSSNGVKEMKGFRDFFNLSGLEDNSTTGNSSEETSAILGLVVALFSLGSLVGALLGGPLSDWAGRRAVLVTGALLSASGIIIQSAAIALWMLLIGRIWSGLGVGIIVQSMPVYIAEIAPKQYRGRMVSLAPMAGVTGNLIAALVNIGVEGLSFGWRVSLGLQLILACCLLIGSPLIPESPRWHVKKNKPHKALKTLKKIFKDDQVVASQLEEISASYQKSQYDKTLRKTFFSRDIAHRLFLGFCLLFFSRVCGISLALYFSVSIFYKIGISGFIGAIIICLSLITAQILVLLIADKFGRKFILLCGYVVMSVCLVAASALILGFGLETDLLSSDKTIAGYFVVACLALFVGVGALSSVSQGWIVVSELYPLKIKGLSVSVASVGWWLGTILSGEISPFLLSSSLGTAGTLILHAVICALGFIFVLLLLPETKQLSLEQVDQLFSTPWLQRTNPLYYLTCGRVHKVLVLAVSSSDEELRGLDISLEDLTNQNDDCDDVTGGTQSGELMQTL